MDKGTQMATEFELGLAATVGAMPDVIAAQQFNATFAPVDGVDYSWVVKHAERKYELLLDAFRHLDDKASGVITYLGSVTGLVAAGVVATAATSRLNVWAVAAFLPAFICAAVAVGLAAHARRPRGICHPPSIYAAIQDAHFAGRFGLKDASATSLGRWHLTVVTMYHVVEAKAAWVNRATWWLFGAVALLGLPLLVVVGRLAYSLPVVYPIVTP